MVPDSGLVSQLQALCDDLRLLQETLVHSYDCLRLQDQRTKRLEAKAADA